MKFPYNLKIVFLSAFVSSQAMGMEEEKATGFLFAGMRYYEEKNYVQAAKIFEHYVGKPVPIAEPYCLDLVRKGYLDSFQPIPCLGESGEEEKARMYFEASQKLPSLQTKNSKALKNTFKQANDAENGPLLYLMGTIYAQGTDKTNSDKDKAKAIFLEALKKGNLRAVFGLKQVCSHENFNKIEINKLLISKIYSVFTVMPKLNQDEGQIFASLSGFFNNNSLNTSTFFLKYAARCGHPDAQFTLGLSHCENESQVLYWMMQCAEYNNCKAFTQCGHMLERGEGTKINYEKAYGYFKRAVDHPEATGSDFWNFGLIHEKGRGTPINNQIANQWYKRAYETDPNNQEFIYYYGSSFLLQDEYEKAFPFLSLTRHISDDAESNYALALSEKTGQTDNLPEAIEIWSKLATKGHLPSAFNLMGGINEQKIQPSSSILRTYKRDLENAILQAEKTKTNIDLIARSYLALRHLYLNNATLFEEEFLSPSYFSGKAFHTTPNNQEFEHNYACDLKEDGQYKEALTHFLKLEEQGYPVFWNSIGSCYDLLAKNIQTKNTAQSAALVQKAFEYYQKQIKEEGYSPHKINAAFNIYALSVQKRIEPLPNEELLHFLQMAVDGGDAEAINDLGVIYTNGWYGIDPDWTKAEQLLREAMAQGVQLAKLNLMYLQFSQKSQEARAEGQQLFQELWAEDSEKFQPFLENLMTSVKMLLQDDEGSSEGELDRKDKQKEEKSEQQISAINLSTPSSVIINEESIKIEEEVTQPLQPLQQASKVAQHPSPQLSRKEKEQQEEKERLQRKYERMTARVEELRSKKQMKYRKIQTLINQHIQAFGGGMKNAKGSGRRIEMGGTHSGFHQPHKADIKGGALESLTNVMKQSSQNNASKNSHYSKGLLKNTL